MAAVRIALCVYYDKGIEKMLEVEMNLPIGHIYFERKVYELLKQIEAKAVEKLPSLPNLLKTRVSKFICPIHYETDKWILHHTEHFGPPEIDRGAFLTYKSIFCWKSDGTIDRSQAAKTSHKIKISIPKRALQWLVPTFSKMKCWLSGMEMKHWIEKIYIDTEQAQQCGFG
ncbi:hypothetical protein AVEN_3586-1 [Araneus ventricosus]|uniref:Uncharacterized protein n=1 Tax=Araneus ventricosus TaxID=182803 RepID=A0A4Y2KTE0_ARAVE|nr:hypothetical protein AVEN_3586-1 [Araneus ventricosus]